MKSNADPSGITINLADLEMEPHVKEAFQKARILTGNQPIDAGNALQAIVLLSRQKSSEAFNFLGNLLPLEDLREPEMAQIPPEGEASVRLSQPLGNSYSIAERFFHQKDSIWGRDFITMILLTTEDPSLQKISKQADSSVETLQDKWYEFVTSSEKHRDAESWRE